jgi:hypothetical protein
LAKLKRNQERRLARKNAKENGAAFPKPGSHNKIDVALSTPVSGSQPVVSFIPIDSGGLLLLINSSYIIGLLWGASYLSACSQHSVNVETVVKLAT